MAEVQQNKRAPRGGRNDRAQAPREEKIFEEFVINIDRVARVVKGGRRFRFKALVAVGDKKNRIGVGVAKGADVQAAVAKATDVAKKNLVNIPVVRETIPHDVEVKFSGARVLLKPAAPGTGIIAGGVVRSIIGLTGIHNMLSKSLGSTNKVNIAYATVEALRQLVPADQWVGAQKRVVKKIVEKPAEKPAKVEDKAEEKVEKPVEEAKAVKKPAKAAPKKAVKKEVKE